MWEGGRGRAGVTFLLMKPAPLLQVVLGALAVATVRVFLTLCLGMLGLVAKTSLLSLFPCTYTPRLEVWCTNSFKDLYPT